MNLDRFSVAIENDYQPFMVYDISNDEWCACGEFMKEVGQDACEDCLEAQEQEDEGMSQSEVDAVIEAFKRAANE